jgi:hypothetical protein
MARSKKPNLATISDENLKEFVRLQKQVDDAEKALAKLEQANPGICHAYFQSLTKTLFDENPRLYSFKWNQYTPSWNDGDTCYFSANTSDLDINGVSNEDMFYGDDEYTEDYDKEAAGAGEAPLPMSKEEAKTVLKAAVDFMRQFKDTQLEHWFGDGVEITVTRKNITVEGYEGDY